MNSLCGLEEGRQNYPHHHKKYEGADGRSDGRIFGVAATAALKPVENPGPTTDGQEQGSYKVRHCLAPFLTS